ncbi:sarcosine dehydrogenase, mitochondrial-like, partial [Herpailurus yagouaroundi]|uniref:sarcosine dehydrogenase, mitochondrial-like n=1 Tax=Herpailurus yagouaroundi TaxID=1608482 RepID=UPI001AD64FCD
PVQARRGDIRGDQHPRGALHGSGSSPSRPQVIENCPVTGIRVRTDDFGVRRVAAVETEHGSIQTPCVVNCAGVWASAVGRMAGVKVPLVAMHHAYVVTERIEGIQVHRLWEAQGPGSEP